MLRRRNLLIGAGLAVLAGALSLGYSAVTEQSHAAREAREPVVVVDRKLPAYQRLERSVVRLERVPKGSVLPGAYRSLDEVVGRVTIVPLWPGDQVIAGRTADPGAPEGLLAELAAGERGFAVPVDAETAGAVHPGDSVDVVAVTPSTDGFSQVSRLVPGVRVLKVGGGGGTSGSSEPWVMLAVSPAQAQALALAVETGRLRLVLRGAADRWNPVGEPPVAHWIAAPSKETGRPSGKLIVKPVEVIRGVEREPQGS